MTSNIGFVLLLGFILRCATCILDYCYTEVWKPLTRSEETTKDYIVHKNTKTILNLAIVVRLVRERVSECTINQKSNL